MAAVRARRYRGGDEPPPKRGRRAAPMVHGAMPRLARIKLSGGIAGDGMPVDGRSLMLGLAGIVMFCGAAIAGAAWLGSSLFDAREAFARTADAAAARVGFAIGDIEVSGVSGARAQEVRELITPRDRGSLLALDPDAVKARVESLDWVASAQVHRLWPQTLSIRIERRQAYARWQEDGEISVIDYNGERLLAERAADHPDLPLVVGAGAGPAAETLLITLEDLPQLRARLAALERVGERRWNLKLKSGTVIALPEAGAAHALQQLEALHNQHALLDRPVAGFDMRAPGRLAVRVRAERGVHAPLLGGA
jgi:cell division protein FtsQ